MSCIRQLSRKRKAVQLELQGYKHSVLGPKKALQVGGTDCTKAWNIQELEHRSSVEKVVAGDPTWDPRATS